MNFALWRFGKRLSRLLMLLAKQALAQSDADSMAEVRAAVTLLVHVVASRHVVGGCASLLDDMEHYQGQCWTHDEWRYQQVKRLQLSRPASSGGSADTKASRMRLRTPGLTHGSALPQPHRDSTTSGRGGDDGSARPPKWKGKLKGFSARPGAQVRSSGTRSILPPCGPPVFPRIPPRPLTPTRKSPTPHPPRPGRGSPGVGLAGITT